MANITDPNNLITPEVLADYMTADFAESNRLIKSGILRDVSPLELTEYGNVLEIPQWDSLGEMQTLTPGNDLNTEGLEDHKMRHPVVRRYKSILNADLASVIAKGNPDEEASRQFTPMVSRAANKAGIATIQGCAAANTSNVVSDTGAAPAVTDFTALEEVFGDILEDYLGNGLWLMRSKVFTAYRELGLVADPVVGDALQDNIVGGRNFFNFRGSILGRNIVVDDELYRTTDKTTGDALTYLVGFGALMSAVQKGITVETGRNISKQANELVVSFHRTMGVNGMDYSATVAKKGPEDSDLRNSSNWALVAEDSRFVPIASIQTNYPS